MNSDPIFDIFCCPNCRSSLREGRCPSCQEIYPRRDGVWEFLKSSGYTASFGYQWQIHAKTQLDQFNGTTVSRDRFFLETGWNKTEMENRSLLEVGAGAGRFTEVALACGAKVCSVEPSEAVFVNAKNHGSPNLHLVRASLYALPFREESFDYLFCLGVIQHTPDVEKAFKALFPFVKKGGRFCVDVYAAPIAYLHPRHLLRPFTRRMKAEKLYERVSQIVPKLLPISNCFHRIPVIGEALARLVPIANWRQNVSLRSESQYLEWSILDTFDWYSPTYEKPQFRRTLERWCRDLQLNQFEIKRIRGLYVIRGIR